MDQRSLAERVARLFDSPAPALRGGIEAAGELPHPAESSRQISAWVETCTAGVRLDLEADGRLRIVAYDSASGQEATINEQPIEALVRETLRQHEGKRRESR